MPHFKTDDGVRIYYEEFGEGLPIIFAHELGDSYEGWAPQLNYFTRRYRCITYAARGFPPSDVPEDLSAYTQMRVSKDVGALMDHLTIESVYLVGVSMGSYTVLNFALSNAERVRGLVVASCGREHRIEKCEEWARGFETLGAETMSKKLSEDRFRAPFKAKDPHGWLAFRKRLATHSPEGCARTIRGMLPQRPSIYSQAHILNSFNVPTLLITGDEDDETLEPTLFMKRHMPNAGFIVLPRTGHNLNIEEPDAFNHAVQDFFHTVELRRWEYGKGARHAPKRP